MREEMGDTMGADVGVVRELAGAPVERWFRVNSEFSAMLRDEDVDGIAQFISDGIHRHFTERRIAVVDADSREDLFQRIVAVVIRYLSELYSRNPYVAVLEDVTDPCYGRMEEYFM